jgi:guanylate kinase
MKNVLMVVSGPSGVGKGTLVKRLCKERTDVIESVSCTTREPRTGEQHGREYFFISDEEFMARIEAGDFLEYDGHFKGFYGTPKAFVEERLKEKSVVLEIDVNGGLKVRQSRPDCVLVMIVPPSKEALRERLQGRKSETQEQIEDRLARLDFELAQKDKYDYVIVNDDLEMAYKELNAVLDQEMKK